MSHENQIMRTTVELVSAYAQAMNGTSLRADAMGMSKAHADLYAEFIETIYKKVEELTASK